MKNKEYNSEGLFNIIAYTIAYTFRSPLKKPHLKSKKSPLEVIIEDKNVRLNFLKSRAVAHFCDCSNNFDQEKLIKEFKRQFYIKVL